MWDFYTLSYLWALNLVSIRSLTIAGSLESLKRRIADDRPIAEKCFHIIADDRWRSPDRWKMFPYNRWRSLAVSSTVRRSWAIIWKLGFISHLKCSYTFIKIRNFFVLCRQTKRWWACNTPPETPPPLPQLQILQVCFTSFTFNALTTKPVFN